MAGRSFGDDMILDNPKLRQGGAARALTYVELARLSRINLDWILDKFPEQRRCVAKSKIKLAIRRWVLREWRRQKAHELNRKRVEERERESRFSSSKTRFLTSVQLLSSRQMWYLRNSLQRYRRDKHHRGPMLRHSLRTGGRGAYLRRTMNRARR